MLANENGCGERKRIRAVLTVLQSGLILVLIALVIFMMLQINKLQGTAKVVNYSGIVRGATQRLTKKEITGNKSDELISYLDGILEDLKNEDGDYGLIRLDDDVYQSRLDILIVCWKELKEQIMLVRESNYAPEYVEELVNISEKHFGLADKMVYAAEVYSDGIAKIIRVTEIISAADMLLLIVLIMEQTISAMRMHRRNMVLAQKAYIDTQTGLNNKNMCEELLNDKAYVEKKLALIMFDINNLKYTNDTYGHSVGDKLIEAFAEQLRGVVREEDFAGRCGGDEFILVLYGVESSETVEDVLKRLEDKVAAFNRHSGIIPISYACGWAMSADYKECTFRTLFDAADCRMYENKKKCKNKRK